VPFPKKVWALKKLPEMLRPDNSCGHSFIIHPLATKALTQYPISDSDESPRPARLSISSSVPPVVHFSTATQFAFSGRQ
jgi:hypothetical protein